LSAETCPNAPTHIKKSERIDLAPDRRATGLFPVEQLFEPLGQIKSSKMPKPHHVIKDSIHGINRVVPSQAIR
jgi:hypothetical protein